MTSLAELAKTPNMTPEILQKYIDANKDMVNFQGQINFNADRAKMAAELPAIEERHRNNQTNSWYAKIEDILDAIYPILAKYGFSVGFENDFPDDKTIKVTAYLYHKDGHSAKNPVVLPLDIAGAKGNINKTAIHATGSSQTYAQRYALNGLIPLRFYNRDNKLSSFDDDGLTGGSLLIDGDQEEELLGLLSEGGIDVEQFCKDYLKVDSLSQLHADAFQKAKNAIINRNKKNADNT